MDSADFLKKLFIDKNYEELLAFLSKDNQSEDKRAKVLLFKGDYSLAASIFKELGMIFEEGYCYFLLGDMQKAKEIWASTDEENPPLLWCRFLADFLSDIKTVPPTYLQIRNFLEIELAIFIENNRLDFVQKIIDKSPSLAKINAECYKFIGRCLLNHSYYGQALTFLQKWKNIEYNDPENLYLLAKCYSKLEMNDDARRAILNCLRIAPNYYPALTFFSPNKVL